MQMLRKKCNSNTDKKKGKNLSDERERTVSSYVGMTEKKLIQYRERKISRNIVSSPRWQREQTNG